MGYVLFTRIRRKVRLNGTLSYLSSLLLSSPLLSIQKEASGEYFLKKKFIEFTSINRALARLVSPLQDLIYNHPTTSSQLSLSPSERASSSKQANKQP